ncbi:trypsin-like serine peptidase [Staphylococcus delphini]|uniref:trypsin-like serine peptidase n=1 Tax=Staphylococcus delphini TaxID=53344 RepID=UPI000BBB8BAE|nr:trypsin-like peptidase domain-containing protein [Staphylococcus delphini]PCF41201.1 Exfoliative toxin A [Staphylococcus delphini]
MKVSLLKIFLLSASVFTISLPIIPISEVYAHAHTYETSEIIKKQSRFNVPPSTLSEAVFSEIKNTARSPYNSVGTVYVKGETIASGVLIGKNTIITNTHVSRFAKNDPSKLIFTPASTRTENGTHVTPYGQFVAEDINESPYGGGTDLSIIKLKPNQDGKSAGDLIPPAKIPDSIDLQAGDIISLLGYPNHYSAFSLFSSQIEIFDVNIGQYFGYTESGNSGSGLFNLQGELVGIHIGKGGSYNLPLGKFFNTPLGSVYSADHTLTTIGNDLKKRAELQAQ